VVRQCLRFLDELCGVLGAEKKELSWVGLLELDRV
jgi:hypothetical protein